MMHTSQDAKDKEINIHQKVLQLNHNAYRHLEAMLCVVMYNYKISNPIACTNFRTCLAVTTTIAIFLHLQGLLFFLRKRLGEISTVSNFLINLK